MRRLILFRGVYATIRANNIDTDVIIPKQFLTITDKRGLGRHLFNDWRDDWFFLDQKHHTETKALVVTQNFGCGSSREHAPWSIKQAGIEIIIGYSFAEIFFMNCVRNGILPVVIEGLLLRKVLNSQVNTRRTHITAHLINQNIYINQNVMVTFVISPLYRISLLRGLKETSIILKQIIKVNLFEKHLTRKTTVSF
jgi:3-isopropylmalate/(R)-2-methylmalate dehydratase small subunit